MRSQRAVIMALIFIVGLGCKVMLCAHSHVRFTSGTPVTYVKKMREEEAPLTELVTVGFTKIFKSRKRHEKISIFHDFIKPLLITFFHPLTSFLEPLPPIRFASADLAPIYQPPQ